MKWTAMLLGAAMLSGVVIGCEQQEPATTTTPPPPATMESESEAAPTTGPATQASASLTVANKYCAVMTEHEVDPKVTVASGGKTVGFCCKDCIETFEKEPAKYLAAMK
jgi:YHS domain-containing protein